MAMYDNLLANVPTELWIGGKWRKSSDNQRFYVIDPATEGKIASVASASVDDAKAAVDAAQDAFAGWAARKPRERAEILRKAFELPMLAGEAPGKPGQPFRGLTGTALALTCNGPRSRCGALAAT